MRPRNISSQAIVRGHLYFITIISSFHLPLTASSLSLIAVFSISRKLVHLCSTTLLSLRHKQVQQPERRHRKRKKKDAYRQRNTRDGDMCKFMEFKMIIMPQVQWRLINRRQRGKKNKCGFCVIFQQLSDLPAF